MKINPLPRLRCFLIGILSIGLVSMSGCGDLYQYAGLVLNTTQTGTLPSAAADAQAPDLLTVSASPSDSDTILRTTSEQAGPLYGSYSVFLPKLTEQETSNFLALYNGVRNFSDRITLPYATTSDEVQKLMTLLANDCPELMQLGTSWGQNSNLLGSVVSVSPHYVCDQTTWNAQYEAVTALLNQFHAQLDGYTPYQIELAIYDYIIGNCVYSLTDAYVQSAYGALIDGKAKCDGRARAMVWALRSFGIESSVITGSDHAWVLLKLDDGFYYNADPTYDDNEPGGVQAPTSYAHFNIPESAIATDPYPADQIYRDLQYPMTVRWDSNYHVKSGLWITAGADCSSLFTGILDQISSNGTGNINLRFESSEDCAMALDAMSSWVQSYLNSHGKSCNITSYDLSDMNMLFLTITFR